MGDFTKNKVTSFDPSNPALAQTTQGVNSMLGSFLGNPTGFMQQMGNTSGLANQSSFNMQNMLGYNPEASAYANAQGALTNIGAGQQYQVRPELQFANGFNEMSDPFAGTNAQAQALSLMAAAQPQFQRNLQDTFTKLNASAPGRFSSAVAQDGRDLGTQALQDYNLFANQAMQQALGLEQQNRESARNFMLGARSNQQGAVQNAAQNQLAARGLTLQGDQLQQAGMQNAAQNQIAAQGLLGQLAANAGNNAFNRNLGAGQFGLAQQQQAINPIMQLLMGAMQYGQPQQLTPIVNPSGLQQLMNFGTQAFQMADLAGMFKGNQQGGFQPGGQFGNTGGYPYYIPPSQGGPR